MLFYHKWSVPSQYSYLLKLFHFIYKNTIKINFVKCDISLTVIICEANERKYQDIFFYIIKIYFMIIN